MSDSDKTQEVVENTIKKNEVYWEGDFLIVNTRSGKTYKFEEQEGSIIEESAKAATIKRNIRNKIVEELKENLMYNKLIVKSCVEPVLKESEFEVNKLKGSESVTMKKAMMQLYDIQSFLH